MSEAAANSLPHSSHSNATGRRASPFTRRCEKSRSVAAFRAALFVHVVIARLIIQKESLIESVCKVQVQNR